ncbi:MAG: hypothetical protein IKI11_09340 [Neisseriaceae bacterium]|nr:hypothetical protein [Neisseriaceae bacterium]
MHAPRPFGLLQYGEELTASELAYVSQLVQQVTNYKTVSLLPTVKAVRALPYKGIAIISDMGGTLRVITNKPPEEPIKTELNGYPNAEIPMLFSGRIITARPRTGQGVTLKLTPTCRRRLNNYSGSLAPEEITLQRFEIEHNPYFVEFIPKNLPDKFTVTQYTNHRATWYSGAMAEVHQIIGGFGITDLKKLPDNPYEQAQLKVPKKLFKRIQDELDGGILPAYYGSPNKNGQFQYDYKFEKTELVGLADKQSPWLIRINRSGVYVMPLPLIPATTTKAFHDYIEEQQDDEISTILNRFGGIPTGEKMPTGKDFEAWQKAGVIIKICDTNDFYDNDAYYSACGWSANLNASEIVNTCFAHEEQSGWQKGKMYIGYLRLGSLNKFAMFPKNDGIDTASDELKVKALQYASRVSALFQAANANDLAVQYKLRRVAISELAIRADGIFNEQVEKQYWQDLELPPIVPCSGGINKYREDYIYAVGKPKNHPQIKFPEPFLGGCISHDFGRLDTGEQKKVFPDMDCPMFAYFIGNDMKTVHYFKDWQDNINKPPDSDYSDCMTVGSWEKTEYLSPTQLAGNFYTSDFDDREEIAEKIRYTKIKGEDKGYDTQPFFAFWEMFSRVGDMWRNRYFTHKTNSNTTTGKRLEVACCIPYYCRNAVIYAKTQTDTGKETTESLGLYAIKDPNTYGFWTYDRIFHWLNTLRDAQGNVVMDGEPYPKNANPVWVEAHYHNDGTCSDFADNGDWVGGMPADYSWLIHPNANEYLLSGGGGQPNIEEYSETVKEKVSVSGSLKVSLSDFPQTVFENKQPDLMYFEMSPSELGTIFYRDADKVLIGEQDYCSISEHNEQGERYHWGASIVASTNSNNHFIGVINS